MKIAGDLREGLAHFSLRFEPKSLSNFGNKKYTK